MYRSFTKVIVQLFAVVQIAIFAGVAHAATKVACIGDSITALPSSWCGDLSTKLGSGYTVSNFGVSGTNLEKNVGQPYWTSAEFTPSHDFAPDIVVIMLGTNDAQPAVWMAGMSHFIADYNALLDSYTSLASHPTPYIILPTPIGYSPFGHTGALIPDAIDPDIKQVAMMRGITTIDAFTAFGGTYADAGAFNTSLYGPSDQVHPNAQGQQIICDLVYDALTGMSNPLVMVYGGDAGSGAVSDAGSDDAGTVGTSGSGGSGNASSGGSAGGSGSGSVGNSGANGGAGSMNASSGAGSGSASAGSSANTGGSGTSGAAAGESAPTGSANQSSGGCRMDGNSASTDGPAAGLLLLFAIGIRRRKGSHEQHP
jgi:acyl-CoA thioesterase I